MKNDFIKAVKNVVIWRLFTLTTGALLSIALARHLGPEARGALTITMLTISIIALFTQFGLPEASVFFIGNADHKVDLLQKIITIGHISSLIGFVITFVAAEFFTSLNAGGPIKLSFLVLLITYNTTARHIFLAMKLMHRYGSTYFVESFSSLCGVILMILLQGLDLKSIFTIYLTSNLLVSVYSTLILTRLHGIGVYRINFSWQSAKSFYSKALHLFIAGLGGFINERIIYFLLSGFTGVKAVGFFTVASAMPNLLSNLPQQMASVLYSFSSNERSAMNNDKMSVDLFRLMIPVLFIAFIGIFLFGEFLIHVLFGPVYLEITDSFKVLSAAVCLAALSSILANALAGTGHHYILSIQMFVNVCCTLIFGLILIPKFGYYGASIAFLFSAIINLIITILFFINVRKIKLLVFLGIAKNG